MACDIVAVDGEARQEELRWLEMLRHGLEVERLHAAAIERGYRFYSYGDASLLFRAETR